MENGYERTKSQRIKQLQTAAPFARHQRWHLRRGVSDPTCAFCATPSEPITTRTCLTCSHPKELNSNNFRPNNRGWRWQCKKCEGRRVLLWMKDHPEKEMIHGFRGKTPTRDEGISRVGT